MLTKLSRRLGGAILLTGTLAACSDGPLAPGIEFERAALRGQALVQVERFGLPAVATVFIPTAKKDAYNRAAPANDRATFRGDVVAVLNAFGSNPALADARLPDIQPINLTQPTGFLNGRRLQDDVITAELGLIFGTNAALNDDNVDANDRAFLGGFPYLAAPNLR
jgi:hypothetical protein